MENNLDNARQFIMDQHTKPKEYLTDLSFVTQMMVQYASLVRPELVVPSEDEIVELVRTLPVRDQIQGAYAMGIVVAKIKELNAPQ